MRKVIMERDYFYNVWFYYIDSDMHFSHIK